MKLMGTILNNLCAWTKAHGTSALMAFLNALLLF